MSNTKSTLIKTSARRPETFRSGFRQFCLRTLPSCRYTNKSNTTHCGQLHFSKLMLLRLLSRFRSYFIRGRKAVLETLNLLKNSIFFIICIKLMGCRNAHVSTKERREYKFKPYVLNRLEPINDNSQLPKGRSGHRIVSDDTYVYSFGGYNPLLDDDQNHFNDSDMKLFKELWRFNISCNEWEKLAHYSPSLPRELVSSAVVMKGNTLIVHGGTGVPFSQNCSNKTYVTNLKQNKTLELLNTKGELPLAQYGQAMVLNGHELFVIGGTSGFEYSANIHCLDLRSKVWRPVYIHKRISSNEPLGRYRHEVAFYNGKIIVFGGGTMHDVFELEHLPAFNIVKNEWEILTTLGDPKDQSSENDHQGFPAPRRCHGSVQIPEEENQDSEFIICGGYNGVNIFSDIWTLNLRTLQWKKWKEELKYPLNFHSTSLSPCGKMFIFGGICERFNEDEDVLTIRTNEIFSSWVKIPKLSEMCWEALLFYSPEITSTPESELLNIGIPIQFVKRIRPG